MKLLKPGFGIFVRKHQVRIAVYGALLLLIMGGSIGSAYIHHINTTHAHEVQDALNQSAQQRTTLNKFAALKRVAVVDANQGIATTAVTSTVHLQDILNTC